MNLGNLKPFKLLKINSEHFTKEINDLFLLREKTCPMHEQQTFSRPAASILKMPVLRKG